MNWGEGPRGFYPKEGRAVYNVRLTHKEIDIQKIPEASRALREFVVSQSLSDYVFLRTCNRAEVYFIDDGVLPPNGFLFECGEEAFRHLLRVACGIESFVVGEGEILNQIREALEVAKKEGHCSAELARYFTDAIRVGRKARRLTRISRGKVSIVSLALEHLRGMLGDLTSKKFLVVGAGEIGTKVARALKNMNVEKILLSNRRYDKALTLASEVGGSAYRFSKLLDLVKEVDVIFCATSAPHLILTKDKLEVADHKLVVVDLSVPRNVEESIRELENVQLISFEDLAEKANLNMSQRMKEIKRVEEIINSELKKSRKDCLRNLYIYAERVRKKEVEKALRLLASEAPEKVINGLSVSLVKKLYHPLRKSQVVIQGGEND